MGSLSDPSAQVAASRRGSPRPPDPRSRTRGRRTRAPSATRPAQPTDLDAPNARRSSSGRSARFGSGRSAGRRLEGADFARSSSSSAASWSTSVATRGRGRSVVGHRPFDGGPRRRAGSRSVRDPLAEPGTHVALELGNERVEPSVDLETDVLDDPGDEVACLLAPVGQLASALAGDLLAPTNSAAPRALARRSPFRGAPRASRASPRPPSPRRAARSRRARLPDRAAEGLPVLPQVAASTATGSSIAGPASSSAMSRAIAAWTSDAPSVAARNASRTAAATSRWVRALSSFQTRPGSTRSISSFVSCWIRRIAAACRR